MEITLRVSLELLETPGIAEIVGFALIGVSPGRIFGRDRHATDGIVHFAWFRRPRIMSAFLLHGDVSRFCRGPGTSWRKAMREYPPDLQALLVTSRIDRGWHRTSFCSPPSKSNRFFPGTRSCRPPSSG